MTASMLTTLLVTFDQVVSRLASDTHARSTVRGHVLKGSSVIDSSICVEFDPINA